MKLERMLSLAINIAARAHLDQFDKGGNPYILHPLWVMNSVRHLGLKYMIVAVLHDVTEDSDITIDELINGGIDDSEVIEALKLLDFSGKDYEKQIKIIAHNEIARAVKLRDIEHNSRVTRIKSLRKKDFDRLEKYFKSYQYLSDEK